jgi:hypothetical protein
MKPIDNRDFELLETLSPSKNFSLIIYAHAFLRTIKRPFQLCPDLNHLNARLLRDAGVDEHELERVRLIRAPLIR